MATPRRKSGAAPARKRPSRAKATAKDGGAKEVQANVDRAEEKGYIGEAADPLPNSAHSLESGPDAPSAQEQAAARAAARSEEG